MNTSTSKLSSTEAAQRYGLTNDHIASLCRRGKVEGHLAGGRLWFVEEDSLKAYLARVKEERAARGRKLSKKIKKEYSAAVEEPYTPSWRMAGSGYALATAVLIVGSLYIAAPLAAESLSDVPWQYMPASVASASADAYNASFIPAAEKYLDFIDAVGDVQAQSYRTLGAAVASALPAPRPESEAYIPPVPDTPAAAALSGSDIVQTFRYFPDALAEVLVSGYTDMATWYAEGLLRVTYGFSDAQVYTYETAASAELAFSDALVQGWTVAVQSFAEKFVGGVYAVAAAQAYTEEAVLDTMSESSDTLGASVAHAILGVGGSAEASARWYKQGNDRISQRMAGISSAASVAGSDPEQNLASQKVCVEDVCMTRAEFFKTAESLRGSQ